MPKLWEETAKPAATCADGIYPHPINCDKYFICNNSMYSYFISFSLYWGIERFGKKSNLSSEFCITEVHTCKEISAKPCFVVTNIDLIVFLFSKTFLI